MKFTKVVLNQNSKTFMIYVDTLEVLTIISIYSSRACQVQNSLILATLQWDKAFTKIPTKYFNYADIPPPDPIIELLENTGNKHTIEVIDDKQSFYRPIYALSLVELEMLKTYIKIYFKIDFI